MTRWLLGVLALFLASAPSFGAHAVTPGALNGTIIAFGERRAIVGIEAHHAQFRLKIPNADFQKSLVAARLGDSIAVVVDNAAKPGAITAMTSLTRPVAPMTVLWVMFCSAALIAGLSAAFLWRRNPVVGVDNRYSNSQTQLALWFVTVGAAYVATNILRAFVLDGDFIGGVELTGNVVALTGLSAFTFGAAKVVASQKADGQTLGAAPITLPPGATQATPVSPVKTIADKARLTDLVRDDKGNADLGDLQMIFVTLAAVIIFLCQSFWWLSALQIAAQVVSPDVDTALLATFGIGQGAYLFKKAATPNG